MIRPINRTQALLTPSSPPRSPPLPGRKSARISPKTLKSVAAGRKSGNFSPEMAVWKAGDVVSRE